MQQSQNIQRIKHPPIRFNREPKSWKRRLNKKVTQYRIVAITPPDNLVTIGW